METSGVNLPKTTLQVWSSLKPFILRKSFSTLSIAELMDEEKLCLKFPPFEIAVFIHIKDILQNFANSRQSILYNK
jgi:hypothetical protein